MAPREAENCKRYNLGVILKEVFEYLLVWLLLSYNKILGDMQYYMIEYLILERWWRQLP
jgi:hypothetical protein